MNRFLRSLLAFAVCASHSFGVLASDSEAAQEFFRLGRGAFERKNFAEAAAWFKKSQQEEPSAGTLLNLAECYVYLGKTASAHHGYLAAAALAGEQARKATDGQLAEVRSAQRREALRISNELSPRLSHVVFRVSQQPAGFQLTLNGQTIQPQQFGQHMALDPGAYEVTGSALGHATFRSSFEIRPANSELQREQVREVTIPTLSKPSSARRESAYWVGGAGIAALGVAGGSPVHSACSRWATKRK